MGSRGDTYSRGIPMARVALVGLGKEYPGGVVAVKDLNLVVEDGEFLILLGPSGCGKTTTLQIVAGLEQATSGHVLFDDERVDRLPPHARDVSVVFQSYALYPHMSVFDNLAFGLRMRKTPRAEVRRRVNEAASLLGIEALLNRRPRELSGGQRQRVALGRAIVRQPRVFLLDEPLSNIDAKLRAQMRLELKALHRRLGATFIYVTHDQVEAMSLGNRIAIMNRGTLLQCNAPSQIYNHPADLFVATFLGSPAMNLFQGTLIRGNPPVFRNEQVNCPIVKPVANQDAYSRPMTLGIRPKDIVLSTKDCEPNTLMATVEFEEPMGDDTYLSLRVGAQLVVARTDPESSLRVGDRVEFSLDQRHVHLFDTQTGERLTDNQ